MDNRQTRSKRTFDRSASLGFRCPATLKEAIEAEAKKRLRDVSSLCIEYIEAGLSGSLSKAQEANN